MINQNPFANLKLDAEEKEIEKEIEAGNYRPVKNSDEVKATFKAYAENTLSKSKNINIRLAEKDVLKLKALAVEEGLPYQTLIASVIHKYVRTNSRLSVD